MNDETRQEQIQENEDNYDRLIVAIEASRGMLSLLVASCNDRAFRDAIIQRYETELAETMHSYRVQLNSQEPSLRSTLEQLVTANRELNAGNVAVLTVTGAEDLLTVALGDGKPAEVDRFFGYLQWTREGLREFPFAIVVWVTPQILKKMSFKAPDFWSWRTGVFRFVATETTEITTPIQTKELQWKATEELESLPLDELLLSVQQIEAEKGLQAPALATLYDRLGQAYRSRVRAGKAENVQQEIELSIEYFQRAIDLQKMLGDKLNLANTLNRLGNFYYELRRYQHAVSTHQQSLEIAREIGDLRGEANVLIGLGIAYQSLGQYQRAIDFYRQSLEIQREIGDRSVLDQQVIEDLCEVDALEEAIELYLETSPLLLQGIAQAAASGDPLALRRAAHCLRSISGTLGAFRLYELCQELEVMGRMGTASDKSLSGEASVLLQQVEAEYARVAAALQLELIVKCHAATAELNATRSTK